MSIEPQPELAKLYMKAGDRTRAVDRLRAAYFIDPKNGEVARRGQPGRGRRPVVRQRARRSAEPPKPRNTLAWYTALGEPPRVFHAHQADWDRRI